MNIILFSMSGHNRSLGKSIYLKTFGDSPMNRILDFLVVFDAYDYTMADIAKHADVSYSTLKYLLPQLVKGKLVVKTRMSGRSQLYKINKTNPAVKRFMQFYWDLSSIKIIQ